MGDTSLRVSDETRDRLKENGNKGESYDELLNRMMDELGW